MHIKILVQEAHKILYFVRYSNYNKRKHKIVAYVNKFCEDINLLTFYRWEFSQTSNYSDTFYKQFVEWEDAET